MVTMRDVAEAAGVSQAAVSYAYNRPDKLSIPQREHILATAAELRYPGPNVVGSSLRSGKVGAVGVMVMDSLSYAFTDASTKALLEGVVMNRQLDDMALTLIPLAHRDYEAESGGADRGGNNTHPALRGLVDAAILHSLPDDNPALKVLIRRGIPIVIIDAPRLDGVPMVCIEDRKAAFAQMSHVLELGHTRVGVIAERLRPDGVRGPVDDSRRRVAVEHVVRERVEGYLAACMLHGLSAVPIVEAGGFDRADGRWAAELLLSEHDVTAMVCTSDEMALAAMDVLGGRGLRVPDEVSVIGFDDAPGSAEVELTTVRQPMVEKGRIAAEMLFRLMAGEDSVETVLLPHELVERATTAPPKRVRPRKR